MKRTICTETDDIESSVESESLIANTPGSMSDHENEKPSGVSIRPEEVAGQIRALTDLLKQQSAHLCELMRELMNEQTNRRHEETTSFKVSSSSCVTDSWSDMVTGPKNPSLLPLKHSCYPTDLLLQDCPRKTDYLFSKMRTQEPKKLPHHRCTKYLVQSTAYQPHLLFVLTKW